jgi:predicted phosphodiesterase
VDQKDEARTRSYEVYSCTATVHSFIQLTHPQIAATFEKSHSLKKFSSLNSNMMPPRFQIMSDLHLETPLNEQSYRKFELKINSDYLCLLGDIGLIQDQDFFWFLENLLQRHQGLTIFYVLGNHEPYQTSLKVAHEAMHTFQERMSRFYGRRFYVLNRTRHDINDKLTVLGCTLWSHITDEQARDIWSTLTDFNSSRGIRDWDVLSHREEHSKDLDWLNEQVSTIEKENPERQIVVLTHHSPTLDERLNDPRHKNSNVRSGFVTDLSQEVCWKSSIVRCWAFGHTHYSGYYHEDGTGKLVYSNQRGYSSFGAAKQPVVKGQIITPSESAWEITDGAEDPGMKAPPAPKQTAVTKAEAVKDTKQAGKVKSRGFFAKIRQWTQR